MTSEHLGSSDESSKDMWIHTSEIQVGRGGRDRQKETETDSCREDTLILDGEDGVADQGFVG